MNQQPSSSATIASTRSNKRSRGVNSERKDNGISQNPTPTTSTADENKCSSGHDILLNSDTTYTTNNVSNSDEIDTANIHNGNNKRPRSRSGVSSSHQIATVGTSTVTSNNGDNSNNETVVKTASNAFTLNVKRESSQVPQMTEDYVELASHLMLHPLSQIRAANLIASGQSTTTTTTTTTTARGTNGLKTSDENGFAAISQALTPPPQSQYLVHISALGYLKSPIRRPTVIEKWSPYEIAIFEASIAEHGKNFARIKNEIGMTKSVQDVIEFYYIWKKTSHYVQWKKEYIPEYLDVDVDE